MTFGNYDVLTIVSEMKRAHDESPFRCAACRTEHVLREAEICADCYEDRARREESARKEAATAASLPPEYQTVDGTNRPLTFESPELARMVKDSTAIARTRAAVDAAIASPRTSKHGKSLVLIGAAGVGKSVLAACSLRAISAAWGVIGSYTSTHRLVVARQNARLGEEPHEVRDALTSPVLVIDELAAKTGPSDATIDVVWRRHERRLCTVYTSGYPPESTRPGEPSVRTRYDNDGLQRRIFENAAVIAMKPSVASRPLHPE